MLLKEKEFNFEIVFTIFSIIVIIISFDLIFQYFTGYNIIGLESQVIGASSFFYDESVAGSFLQSFGFFSIYKINVFFYKKKAESKLWDWRHDTDQVFVILFMKFMKMIEYIHEIHSTRNLFMKIIISKCLYIVINEIL